MRLVKIDKTYINPEHVVSVDVHDLDPRVVFVNTIDDARFRFANTTAEEVVALLTGQQAPNQQPTTPCLATVTDRHDDSRYYISSKPGEPLTTTMIRSQATIFNSPDDVARALTHSVHHQLPSFTLGTERL